MTTTPSSRWHFLLIGNRHALPTDAAAGTPDVHTAPADVRALSSVLTAYAATVNPSKPAAQPAAAPETAAATPSTTATSTTTTTAAAAAAAASVSSAQASSPSVTVLVDADKAAMQAAISTLVATVKRCPGPVLVYYTGHSLNLKGENYLIPTGAKVTTGAKRAVGDAVSLKSILAALKDCPSPFNAAGTKNANNKKKGDKADAAAAATPAPAATTPAASETLAPGLAEVPARSRFLVVSSAKPNQTTAAERERQKTSFLASALLEEMSSPAFDEKDGSKRLLPLLCRASDRVATLSAQSQDLWLSHSMAEDVVFAPQSTTATTTCFRAFPGDDALVAADYGQMRDDAAHAAAQNHPHAHFLLGLHHDLVGSDEDDAAVQRYKRSVARGHGPALFTLALLVDSGYARDVGSSPGQLMQQARTSRFIDWCQHVAKRGAPIGEYLVAKALDEYPTYLEPESIRSSGQSVGIPIPVWPVFEEQSKTPHGHHGGGDDHVHGAHCNHGHGHTGRPISDDERDAAQAVAAKYYERSATQGLSHAQSVFGWLLYHNLQDEAGAKHFWTKAAEQNDIHATVNLGNLLRQQANKERRIHMGRGHSHHGDDGGHGHSHGGHGGHGHSHGGYDEDDDGHGHSHGGHGGHGHSHGGHDEDEAGHGHSHESGHGHSHGGESGHGHSHGAHDEDEEPDCSHGHGHSHGDDNEGHGHSHGSGHGHSHGQEEDDEGEHEHVDPHELEGAAFVLFQRAASRGNPAAMAALGDMYASGAGCIPDRDLAFTWTKRAAEKDHGHAQYLTGMAYLEGEAEGRSATINQRESVKWLRKAAMRGHASAQFSLSVALGAKPQDAEEAKHWLVRAAEGGHPNAQVRLAIAYARGDGHFAQDLPRAAELFKKAGASGSVDAIVGYGDVLQLEGERLEEAGDAAGAHAKFAAAVSSWLTAAKRHHPQAIDRVAEAYRVGQGVVANPDVADQLEHEAKELWMQRGNETAAIDLAGRALVERTLHPDLPRWLKLHMQRSHNLDNRANAALRLGQLSAAGLFGSSDAAVLYFAQAADGGSSLGMLEAGKLLVTSANVDQRERGIKYLRSAGQKGLTEATELLKTLASN
ncbi:hypothetical protein CAOG_04287 [Capsaspora owczarzaki ATCC 30864]|uniref:hypothetical protein n=1 Tax=Capsaspora owczarzaki (strain ATCC 30864) TaxID=595528 RepID=UPI0003521856|nr:hypothetical protein CAOG_04287 [Capsaspora owczarzaki ATCC 30864]|eukprot:XP_004348112.2 hypothetical protein CAOG_04287 [Capsaspora owczarzaki ATCC 30864]